MVGRVVEETTLMVMSSLNPRGKPCSAGTHNETVKKLTLFSAVINGIIGIMASNLESRGNVMSFSVESNILSPLP